jgi:hypothetical protein
MQYIDLVSNFLVNMSPAAYGAIGAILEFGLRMVKSDKPLSILHLIGGFARKIGELLVKIADFSDKVLPQRLS